MSSTVARHFLRASVRESADETVQCVHSQLGEESERRTVRSVPTAELVHCSAHPPSPELSDEALFSLICEGDNDALSLLFRRYARIVRGVAFRVLRDASEADDLLQDVFLLVHRLCRTFDSSKGSGRFLSCRSIPARERFFR
jgi:hypothetical protein